MATVGHFSGTKILVFIDGVLIGCQRDSSLESQFETIDATCKDNDGAKATLPGQLSWSVSMDAVQVFDATKGVKQLMTSHLAKQSVYVAWTTGIEADPIFTGNAYITQLTQNGPLNDTATYSVTFTGDGPMTQSVVAAGGYPD